jgi:archaemetzincin
MGHDQREEDYYTDLDYRLRHLAEAMPRPRTGDGSAGRGEKGQTFAQYLAANPVRRGREYTTLYLCLLGEFVGPRRRILDLAREYLGLFFSTPVRVRRHASLSAIPAAAGRKHPHTGRKQLLTTFILQDLLRPDLPEDALAYLAITGRDLWTAEDGNDMFGEADLYKRVGVLSTYHNGWPGDEGGDSFRLNLRRTLLVAAHETAHTLTMKHCIARRCLMNECNSHEDRDWMPLHPCPVCLRKLAWNLQVEPVPYLKRLGAFCGRHGLEEAGWFARAAEALEERTP